MGEMVDLDAAGNAIYLADGSRIPYDYLIIATGSSHSYLAMISGQTMHPA